MAFLKKTQAISPAPTNNRSQDSSPRLVAEATKVLHYPVVSEKAAKLASLNQYVFAVRERASKVDIAKAVKVQYGVKPQHVTVINVQGKKVRIGRGGHKSGQRRNWRKAIVTLPKGQSLNLIEGV